MPATKAGALYRKENGQSFYALPAGSVPQKSRRAPPGLFVEPDVFHAPAVVDAVDHDRQSLDVGLPAVPGRGVEDDRPNAVLGQLLLDLPHQRFALFLVRLRRLLVDQFVELGIAVFDVVSFRAAYVILVEILIGFVDAVAGEIECDRKILAVEPWEPLGRIDRF